MSKIKTNSPEYGIWVGMKQRCLDRGCRAYRSYGGRGITVSKEWLDSFEAFYRDMGPRPSGLSLDRIDNERGYSKENCRWATKKEQQRNTRANIFVMAWSRRIPLAEACEQSSLPSSVIRARLKLGWTPEDALTRPISRANNGVKGSERLQISLPPGYVSRYEKLKMNDRKFSDKVRMALIALIETSESRTA